MNNLAEALLDIRREMLAIESSAASLLEQIPLPRRLSARNLLHYVALRRRDIRELQDELVRRGLSSMGRCESFVLANLEAVLSHLNVNVDMPVEPLPTARIPVDFAVGRRLLGDNAGELLGYVDVMRPSIMVTMDRSAADDYPLMHELVEAGMSVMRINCAHDDETVWKRMIENLRRAERELERSCRIAMDLAGPKIRTGPIEAVIQVLKWRPHRDSLGRVTAPARIWIGPDSAPNQAEASVNLVNDQWKILSIGDTLRFFDAAGRTRRLDVVSTSPAGVWAESTQTTYVTPETQVHRIEKGEPSVANTASENAGPSMRFDGIRPRESFLLLHKGNRLRVTGPEHLGCPAKCDEDGTLVEPASIGCTLPSVFKDARCGERILFDDGKIAGVIREVASTGLLVEITRARSKGEKLRADKGINLPDTQLLLPALTPKDLHDLEFVTTHADIVNYSFVRRPEDIRHLRDELSRLQREDMPLILKIENRQAFDNLPLLLLEVMKSPSAGVMVARGDLAIECGFERLVEVQEEILWMCEAAHIPVVWATQVLEELAKSGLPTRAEVTDAGMGSRAECVMLNKGDNIVDAVRSLTDILHRMQTHQFKKRSIFRPLHLAEHLMSGQVERIAVDTSKPSSNAEPYNE